MKLESIIIKDLKIQEMTKILEVCEEADLLSLEVNRDDMTMVFYDLDPAEAGMVRGFHKYGEDHACKTE